MFLKCIFFPQPGIIALDRDVGSGQGSWEVLSRDGPKVIIDDHT